MVLTMDQLRALGIDSVTNIYSKICKVTIDRIRQLDPTSNQLADICDGMERHSNNKDCKECKESFARSGCVCGYHYHDYIVICGNPRCKSCFLLQCYFYHNPQEEEAFLESC